MKHWRTLSIAVAAAVALGTSTWNARAEESKAPAAVEQPAAAPAQAEAGKGMEGCNPDGSCCGACQQMKQEMAAKGDAGGCPCQKAKQQQTTQQ